ncbi:substrate-binding domain-containing protein [Halobacillus halophilus]|uniref:LacI family DNA-binding transcriptional regulator n=1 Tax=Halobacillus halophilus TaxID=1570 RepID=UPI0013696E8A|nr:LacI family DNA-binding transcriptional regulator [Halobacillus halophilus]MYL29739.1 substrate-binding domain-containing protein [Halobacillus halophilus]
MKVTIYDVAEKASVSISTVSKVLNEKGNINEKTKQRVYDAIKALDYKPSVVLSVQKAMKTIGVLIPDIANPFMAEVTRAVEDSGRKKGFNVMICSTDNDPDKEEEYITMLQQKYLDGMIIATGLKNSRALNKLKKSEVPVVLLTRDVPKFPAHSVMVDDFQGGYDAGTYLAELGHKRVAALMEDVDVPSIKQRFYGLKEALQACNVPMTEASTRYAPHSLAESKQAALDLLSQEITPTAIFASTEILAVGVLQAAKEKGLKVPEDLSVIGFDNSILAQVTDPQLTTIGQPAQKMGEKAIELFVEELLDKKEQEEKIVQRLVLTPSLIERESTARLT